MGRDKKLVTILLQFDFSKAFDTVLPSKLLHKLIDLGFSKSALLWVHSTSLADLSVLSPTQKHRSHVKLTWVCRKGLPCVPSYSAFKNFMKAWLQ